jgi:hypothetical protein
VAKKSLKWKKGPGKLGVLAPLIGSWMAESDSPMGKVSCTREFSRVLHGKYIRLEASWKFSRGTYEETALYGVDGGKAVFWSYTSDGKRSHGTIADGTDLHPEAICFEARMPAGLARMIYWPGEGGTMNWAVESKTKKGWRRFTIHEYRRK